MGGPGDDVVFFDVRHVDEPPCPRPPEEIAAWVLGSYVDPKSSVEFRESLPSSEEDDSEIQRFDDSPRRVGVWNGWIEQRNQWLEELVDIKKRNEWYYRLLNIYNDVSSDPLREVVVGRYLVEERAEDGVSEKRYPIFAQRLHLEKRVEEKLIRVEIDTEVDATFHTSLFADTEASRDGELQELGILKNRFNVAEDWLGVGRDGGVKPYVQAVMPRCVWVDSGEVKKTGKTVVTCTPVMFVRKKDVGITKAIEQIRQTFLENGAVPDHIFEIVCGCVPGQECEEESLQADSELSLEESVALSAGQSKEILTALSANSAQLQIIKQLEHSSGIVVQGPPGTGKTHTIANLIGHYLSEGKRVLVTAHTEQALAVVRDKLPEEIRDLAIDFNSKGRSSSIEDNIRTFDVNRAKYKTKNLELEIKQMADNRIEIYEELDRVRREIGKQREMSHGTLVFHGKEMTRQHAAEKLAGVKGLLEIIPDKLNQEVPCPLEQAEFNELYSSNEELDRLTIQRLETQAWSSEKLLSPERLELFLTEERARNEHLQGLSHKEECVGDDGSFITTFSSRGGSLSCPSAEADEFLKMKFDEGTWRRLLGSGLLKTKLRALFDEREMRKCKTLLDEYEESFKTLLHHESQRTLSLKGQVTCEKPVDYDEVLRVLSWYEENHPDCQLNWLQKQFCKGKADLLQLFSVDGHAPASKEDLNSVRKHVVYQRDLEVFRQIRQKFVEHFGLQAEPITSRWIQEHEVGEFKLFQELPAFYEENVLPLMERVCAWNLEPEVRSLKEDNTPEHRFEAFVEFMDKKAVPVLMTFEEVRNRDLLKRQREAMHEEILKIRDKEILRGLLLGLEGDLDSYREAYEKVLELSRKQGLYDRRCVLLDRLKTAAPEWAKSIRYMKDGFDMPEAPQDVEKAWRMKQLETAFEEISPERLKELSQKERSLSEQLKKASEKLIIAKAWKGVVKLDRSLEKRLSELADAFSKMGRRTAARYQEHVDVVRNTISYAMKAVPVWIMPIGRALEYFDAQIKFDLIVVDEASQANLLAVPLLALGKKIVVVGDDKQVDPAPVCDIDKLTTFRNAYLHESPRDAKLFTEKTSLYDIARFSFDTLMLTEHFRCMNEIIQFSNQNFYSNMIEPLRSSASTEVHPSMVDYRCRCGTFSDSKNELEAKTIASLIRSCIQEPAYKGKTFGVINLMSSKSGHSKCLIQALQDEFSPTEQEELRLRVGTPADFQGDERDVVFLSMMTMGEDDKPLRKLSSKDQEQRYNVAVSRGRDQVWVVHSMPKHLLDQEDLRYKLITHANQVMNGQFDFGEVKRKADSDFEVAVANALISRGYKIEQQIPVGAYRLDMVAYGENGRRVAIECDGEKYHSGLLNIRRDMVRQAQLERVGWTFIRIPGEEHARNPDGTIDRVCNELKEHGVLPQHCDGNAEANEMLNRITARVGENGDLVDGLPLPSNCSETEGDCPREDAVGVEERNHPVTRSSTVGQRVPSSVSSPVVVDMETKRGKAGAKSPSFKTETSAEKGVKTFGGKKAEEASEPHIVSKGGEKSPSIETGEDFEEVFSSFMRQS